MPSVCGKIGEGSAQTEKPVKKEEREKMKVNPNGSSVRPFSFFLIPDVHLLDPNHAPCGQDRLQAGSPL
jgi:hypothetical protein